MNRGCQTGLEGQQGVNKINCQNNLDDDCGGLKDDEDPNCASNVSLSIGWG